MSKHSHSTANRQTDSKRERIQRWLMQEGWKIAEAHHPQAAWIISATNDSGVSLVVVQPASMPDRIEIQTAVTVAEEHQKHVAGMDSKQRQELWWRLRFELLKLGVDFQGFDEPVKQVSVMQRMYDDGLTKDRFLQRVTKVKNAQVMILWTILRALDQPPDDDILNERFIN